MSVYLKWGNIFKGGVKTLIKIAVCDDEEIMLSKLTQKAIAYMEHTDFPYQIFPFLSAEALLKSNEPYDIVFLDIQMKGMTGLEAALKLREVGSDSFIVFVTVLKECVYDVFEVKASDYLLKPVDDDRFKRTMDRILSYIEDRKKSNLFVQKGTWCKSIRFADILYCEIINRKIYAHTKQGVIDYYFKIEELEKQLDTRFFKCHRSYLVNLQYVCGCENGLAELENGENIPISRLRQQEFVQAVLCYMKAKGKYDGVL